jgi:hypothetical protein
MKVPLWKKIPKNKGIMFSLANMHLLVFCIAEG